MDDSPNPRVLAALEELESLSRSRFVALDFETATASRDSACALGLVVVEGGEIVGEASWLIRPPGNRYEYRNTQVHGLIARDTADSPDFGELWAELSPWLDSPLLVAHNAAFDLYVLKASLEAYGVPMPPVAYGCTMNLARKALPSMPNHKLDTLARKYGIELVHHEAASDARACARIGLRLAEQAGAERIEDAFRHFRVKTRRLGQG